MRTATLLILTACAATAAGSPFALVPRLDPDGLPLPTGAVRRLGSGLFRTGHPAEVAFSPDCAVVYVGRYVGGDVPGLAAWDAATGKPVWTALAKMTVTKIVPAADDKTLWVVGHEYAGGSFTAIVAHVRAVDGALLSRRRFATDSVHLTQVTPTGRVAVHSKNGVDVYDPGHEKPILKVPNESATAIQTVILSRDGKRLLAAIHGVGADGRSTRLTGYELPSGREAWTTETESYASVTAHPDGRRAWTQVQRMTVRPVFGNGMVFMTIVYEPSELQLWNLTDGVAEEPQRINRYPEHGGISSPHFRPGGKSALAQFNGGLAEFEVPSWKYKRTLADLPNGQFWLSPDGNTLAVVNGTLALFDVDTGKRIGGRVTAGSSVATLRIDAGQVTLQRGEADETLDLATGREVTALARPKDMATRVQAKGGKLVVRRGERERELAESDGFDLYNASVTPDGKHALCGNSGVEFVRVWDAATGEKKHDLVSELPASGGGYSRSSPNVRCSTDGRHVAVHEFNLTVPEKTPTWHVSVWEIASGKLVRKLIGPGGTQRRFLHWSKDGKTLIVTGDVNAAQGVTYHGFVAVCDPFSDDPPRIMRTNQHPEQVAVSGDGKSFAVAVGRTVEFWDINGNALRHTLRAPPFGVTAMAFTPDAQQFVADGPDGTFLYPLPDLRRPPVAPPPRLIR